MFFHTGYRYIECVRYARDPVTYPRIALPGVESLSLSLSFFQMEEKEKRKKRKERKIGGRGMARANVSGVGSGVV